MPTATKPKTTPRKRTTKASPKPDVTARSTARTRVEKRDGVPGGKFTEIGASGLQIVGGRVNEEFLPVLRGERGVRMWREMGDNDPYSGALLYGLLQTVLRSEWSIALNEADVSSGDFLEQCRDDMEHPFRDVVAEAMTMGQYGWAFLETVFKMRTGPDADNPSDYDDGKIGWRKMPLRAQETLWRWTIDPTEGDIIGLQQRLWGSELDILRPSYVDIPMAKGCLFRTTHHKNNPEGRSMLRSGWVPYDKRKKIEIYEGIGAERDLAGMPVFYIPAENMAPNASADQQAAVEMYKTIGRNIRNDDQGYLVMPQEYDPETGGAMYKFELASTNGRRLFDTGAIIERLATAQLMSIMADVMMIGHEGSGSLALSRTKEQMFTSGVQSMLDEVREILNNDAIPRLFRLNGMAPPFPQFTTSPIQRIDPSDFVTMILNLAQSGMPLWPDDDLDEYVRDFLGWPERANPGLGMDYQKTDGLKDEVIEDPITGEARVQEPVGMPPAPGAKPTAQPPVEKGSTGTPRAASTAAQIDEQGADAKGKKKPAKVGG